MPSSDITGLLSCRIRRENTSFQQQLSKLCCWGGPPLTRMKPCLQVPLGSTLFRHKQNKPSLLVRHCPAVHGVLSLHAFPNCRFRLDYALSREQQNKRGGKMYIQDKVEEYADEVFDLLDNGAHIYFCGLKGMMPGGPGDFRAAQRAAWAGKPKSCAWQGHGSSACRGGFVSASAFQQVIKGNVATAWLQTTMPCCSVECILGTPSKPPRGVCKGQMARPASQGSSAARFAWSFTCRH